MWCYFCAYRGDRDEFWPEVLWDEGLVELHCPRCNRLNGWTTIEERIKELCQQIKECLTLGELERIVWLADEAIELNEFLNLEEEGKFLAKVGILLTKTKIKPSSDSEQNT